VPTPDDVVVQVCPGLKSRSHCPDQFASSGELSKYALYLPVGCEDCGSPSERQAGGHLGLEKDSCYEPSLL
jgi:hypothetical protein